MTDCEEIFDYWRIASGHSRARLDDKRRVKISSRLRDKYTKEDLFLAIEGCMCSKWHNGDNDRNGVFNDIELICRDASHVDRFISIAEQHYGTLAMKEIAERKNGNVVQLSQDQKDSRRVQIRQMIDRYKVGQKN